MRSLPGIAGSLFPHRYLAEALPDDVAALTTPPHLLQEPQIRRWWVGVEAACGPATGLRALFDLVAMPLFRILGFRAHDAVFEGGQARAWLATRRATPVGLVLLPWAERPSALWRDLTSAARDVGAAWAFLLAPPYLSLVDARGHATRRGVEFTLPEALDPASVARLWWLARADAFDPVAPGAPISWIDALVARANGYQDRVRDDLQHGVAEALACLSAAIAAAHRTTLRNERRQPTADTAFARAPFDEALTIVYRILFLLFAESRDLVPVRVPTYSGAYAIGTLGREARSEGAVGLWEGLAAVTRLSRLGCRTDDLIVRPFNGRLFARAAAPSLEHRTRSGRRSARSAALDAAARRALIALGSRSGPAGREDISYADLGVEQLGTVYERVLDLDEPSAAAAPAAAPRTGRRGRHSARRKQTGTFYTPRALAEFVVRRTLAPLTAGASADEILRLRVVDPAMGSGAFLVAACRFLAAAYERALIDEGRLVPADLDEPQRADIRRLIAERCLAGVDQNAVAVQLARLSLWLATLAQGKPLSFLDHRLRAGNSLIGASPADLSRVPGRRPPHTAPLPLFDDDALEASLRRVAAPLTTIASRRDDTVADVRVKEAIWSHLTSAASPLHVWRQASTLWCARWFWPATDEAPGPAEWRALIAAVLRGDRTLPSAHVAARLAVAADIGRRQGFFHWPLEFADVFYDREGQPLTAPGFDAVIGNPPWEVLRQGSTLVDGSSRDDRRGLTLFVRDSGLYPSCDRGHLNLYQPFVERALSIVRPRGRIGLVLPWGLAADEGARALRRRLLDDSTVDTIVGLDNAEAMFPIHRGLRFLALTTTVGSPTREIRARFGVRTAARLDDLPGRVETAGVNPFPVRLTPQIIRQVGGTAMRIPDVRRAGDLSLLEQLTARFPPLGSQAGWGLSFGRELNATEDREHFGPRGLPVLEGKHLSPFRVDPSHITTRIERRRARQVLPDGRFDRARLGYRDVSGVGNRLTLIAAVIPAGTVTTHTIFCLRSVVPIEAQHFLCGLLNSYVLNALARMLMGGHLTTSLVEGLPVPSWSAEDTRHRRIAGMSARLARGSVSIGATALLHAAIAQLYGLEPEEFDQMLEGFPLVPASEREQAARVFRALVRRNDQGPANAGTRSPRAPGASYSSPPDDPRG